MRTLSALTACLALSGCKSCTSSSQPETTPDAGAGIAPIAVTAAQPDAGNKPAAADLMVEKHQELALVARGYATIPAKARPLRPEDARARKGLAQAISGLRYAVTGEDKVIVMPQSPAQLPPHQIERSQELGLNVATITLRVPNPGGTAAMATGKITIGKVKPSATHIQRARLDAIERIAKQSRGSGQILPISATAPRVVDGVLSLEVSARVFRDGTP